MRQTFGVEVDQELKDCWTRQGAKAQTIGQAEIYPVLLAKVKWGESLLGRRVLVFLDNESAKCACIKGWSAVESSNDILRAIGLVDAAYPSWTWYSRVPSQSNPADMASRLQVSEAARRFGAERVEAPSLSRMLRDRLLGKGDERG